MNLSNDFNDIKNEENNHKDEDIDFSDIPETDKKFWANAKIVFPKKKKSISLRIDEDILDWFKSEGKGYQSRMNYVLRIFYKSQHPHN